MRQTPPTRPLRPRLNRPMACGLQPPAEAFPAFRLDLSARPCEDRGYEQVRIGC
jgi:hypothetical protein